MDDAVKLILKKLETIEGRLGILETDETKPKTSGRDPLFDHALKLILESDEDLSTGLLAKKLNTSPDRVSQIMDQLAAAGYGETYTADR